MINGSVFLKPYWLPDRVNKILLGPGVPVANKVNITKGNSKLCSCGVDPSISVILNGIVWVQLLLCFLLIKNCNGIYVINLIKIFIVPMTIWQPKLIEVNASTNSSSKSNTPKYKQLADAIDLAISQGTLKADEKLPPQRRLADSLSVTVGTVTRAYSESERRGSVVARVGSGTYVKSSNNAQYLSLALNEDCFDLQSAKAPMAMQVDLMASALKEISAESQVLACCLTYQPEIALKHQREHLASWLTKRAIHCEEDNVLFTYGGQHAISLALQTVCRAGDTVLCEGLSFPGITVACQQQQLRCIGLQMDEQGIVPESLIAACIQSNPRILYLTAQIQNPTSVQMPLSRKKRIVEICQEYGLVILDDDVQFLAAEDKVSSFYQLATDSTIYLSSFSKSFSGGLRLGYIVASNKYREPLKVNLRASCWTVPPLIIEIVCRWLTNGTMNKVENWLAQEMRERNRIMVEILADFELTFQASGFMTWLVLPEQWRAVDFVEFALQKGVMIRAAESYAVGRFSAPQCIRICTCAPQTQAQLIQALNLLKSCLLTSPQANNLIM